MAEPTDESVVSDHRDNLTANIHGTGDLVVELKYCKWAVSQKKFEDASAFFEKALEDGQWKEGREHYIKLHDDNPIDFARCIQFLYRGRYAYHSPKNSWFGLAIKPCENVNLKHLVFGRPIHGCSDQICPHKEGNEADEFEGENDDTTRKELTEWGQYLERSYSDEAEFDNACALEKLKSSDIERDDCKCRAEVDIAMGRLADKYSIPSLQEYATTRLQENAGRKDDFGTTYDRLCKALTKPYRKRSVVDQDLRSTTAVCIARDYKAIKTTHDDAATTIGEWLGSDDELCSMVMDEFAETRN